MKFASFNSYKNTGQGKYDFFALGLLFLTALLPPVTPFLLFFAPAVAAYLLSKKGNLTNSLSLLIAFYFLVTLLDTFTQMRYISILLVEPVLITGVLLTAHKRKMVGPVSVMILFLLLCSLELFLTVTIRGGDVAAAYKAVEKAMMDQFWQGIDLYKESYGKEFPAQISEAINQMAETLKTYLPSMLLGYIFSISFLNTLFFQKLLLKSGALSQEMSFENWRMPEQMVWLFILSGFMALVPWEPYSLIGRNAVVVVSFFYLVQGFAIIKFFFKIMDTPLIIRGLIYIVIGIQWFGLLLVVLTGLFDNWFDFRARLQRSRLLKENSED